MKDIHIRNVEQLGAAIRLRRREKGLSQAALAGRLVVERKWVLKLEAGNPSADLGLVLMALDVLGLHAFLGDRNRAISGTKARHATSSGLDEVFRRLERAGRK